MPRPDFFFVGHPRSGSGLLDSYLAGHPDIFMGRKELHYFGSDLRYHEPPRSEANYLAHFNKAQGQRHIGEASTWGLSATLAAAEIAAFAPQARVIMMLREPVSWLHSLHSHLVFTGDEDITDFAESLAAEPDRLAGRRLPAHTIPANALHYRKNTAYPAQVQRFFEVFGRERVHVMILDDMRDSAPGEYRKVLEFLDLPTEFPGLDQLLNASQRSRNSNRTVYSERLRAFINHPAQRRILEGVDPAPLPGWGMTIRALRRGNIRYIERDRMDTSLRASLRAELRPMVEELESLLGRALPSWKD